MSSFYFILSKSHFWHLEQDIQQACLPFFNALGFNYFDYSRVYSDGSFITFISDQPYSDFFFNYSNYERHTTYALPTSYLPTGKYLWTSYIDAPFLSLANQQFKHGLGFTCIHHYDGYVELTNFAAPNNKPEVLEIFVNHPDLLNMFIVYFTEKFSSFLNNKRNRIFVPKAVLDQPHETEQAAVHYGIREELLAEIKKMKKMSKKQIPLAVGNTLVELSLREFDCLTELRKGISSKEVARNLNISYRTVELYCAKLMEKMNVHKRTELLNKIAESVLIK